MPDKSPALAYGLYAVIDDTIGCKIPLFEAALAAIAGGAGVLQLRLERTSDREALALAKAVVEKARPLKVQVIVNDRIDLALLSGADGVHLGEDDLTPQHARQLLGPNALVGATTRSLEQIKAAQKAGADHVGLGPVFQTSSKQVDHPTLGVEGLAEIVKDSPLPVVAIAGINLSNIGKVAQTGAHNAAVLSDLLLANDVGAQAAALNRAFFSNPPQPK